MGELKGQESGYAPYLDSKTAGWWNHFDYIALTKRFRESGVYDYGNFYVDLESNKGR